MLGSYSMRFFSIRSANAFCEIDTLISLRIISVELNDSRLQAVGF